MITRVLAVLLLFAIASSAIKADLDTCAYLKVLQDACDANPTALTTEGPTIDLRLAETNVKLLANAFDGTQFPPNKEIVKLGQLLITQLEIPQIVDIYTAAIDATYNVKNKDMLAAHLWQIYDNSSEKSLKVMLRAQLYLYWKFVNGGDVEDSYLLNVAYYFYKIRNDTLYDTMNDAVLKRRVDKAIENLPSSLQFLFFKPLVCLRNKEYAEHLYTTVPDFVINYFRRHIFTWYNRGEPVGTAGDWIVHINELPGNNTDILELKFALESKLFEGRYMDMALTVIKADYLVNSASGSSTKPPKSSEWSLELVENQLVFKQGDLYMCASQDRYDTHYRRFVYGYNDEQHTALTESCQWYAEKCPY